MPNAKVHGPADERIGNALMVAGLLATPLLGLPGLGLLVAGAVGRYVGPDLDIHDKVTEGRQRVYGISQALGSAWRLYWLPYGLIAGHRKSSHRWTGTFHRFIYLYWTLLAMTSQLSVAYPDQALNLALFWLLVLLGHGVLDANHVRLDRMNYFAQGGTARGYAKKR